MRTLKKLHMLSLVLLINVINPFNISLANAMPEKTPPNIKLEHGIAKSKPIRRYDLSKEQINRLALEYIKRMDSEFKRSAKKGEISVDVYDNVTRRGASVFMIATESPDSVTISSDDHIYE